MFSSTQHNRNECVKRSRNTLTNSFKSVKLKSFYACPRLRPRESESLNFFSLLIHSRIVFSNRKCDFECECVHFKMHLVIQSNACVDNFVFHSGGQAKRQPFTFTWSFLFNAIGVWCSYTHFTYEFDRSLKTKSYISYESKCQSNSEMA